METTSPVKFSLKLSEITYKADIYPPILEIALPQDQATLLKNLCENFDIRFRDFVFNNQSISSGLIYFRKNFTQSEYFESLLGVDELQTSYANPATASKTWEPTLRVLESIREIGELSLKTQKLTFNLHCSPVNTDYITYINKFNNLPIIPEKVVSKGATFIFQLPWQNSEMRVIMDRSMLIEDGLFILVQAYLDGSLEYQNIFFDILSFLKDHIQPILQLELSFQETT